MDVTKSVKLILLLFLGVFSAKAQDTLTLSREQSEAVFLKENLLLVAEKLQISKAEALVLQARLWPNPTIEIDEVNLWATQRQLNVFGDELQGFNGGNFGRNQQISFSIEQLILTAGKRRKLVAVEEVSVAQSRQYFEELLRNLKIELRNQLTNLQYLQSGKSLYENQLRSVRQLTRAYQKQVEQGNVSQGEYIRLKALELEIAKELNELNGEVNESQKELKLLMRLPATTYLEISDTGYVNDMQQLRQLVLADLIEQAKEHRPDYKLAKLEESYFNNLYDYERAQRTPDITLKGGYDRGGNFMYNFVGFGIAMDLPFFNRNRGNIKYAREGIKHSNILYQQMALNMEQEIVLSYRNLLNVLDLWEGIEPEFEDSLDELLGRYTKNFAARNISMLEYLDFMDAYLENKKIILETNKSINEKIEELNYTIGTDLIK